jgi:hypothetical protein
MATPYNDFLGAGGTGTNVQKPYDPNDEPNPANPGGVSNNALKAQQAAQVAPARPVSGYVGGRSASGGASYNPAAQTAAFATGNVGGAAGAYAAGNDKTRAAFDQYHQNTRNWAQKYADNSGIDLNPFNNGGAPNIVRKQAQNAQAQWQVDHAGNTPTPGSGASGGVRPELPQLGGAGMPQAPGTPGAGGVNQQGPAPAAAGTTPAWSPVSADVSSYDAGTAAIQQAQNTFQSELTRLSGVDPFGNQAAMQKATDRGVAQAAGTAAMARGGAAAQAGALRGQQGVQSQLASRGIQDMAQQRTTDQNAASQQRLQAAGGIMSGAQAIAENEGKKADAYLKASEQNLRASLGGRELDQRERESLRSLSTEIAKIDQQRYDTDMDYRASVNQNLTEMYKADTALQGLKYSTDAGENLSNDEWMMGLMGAGAGLAMKSDRRSKYAIRNAKLSEMKEYLGATKGSHYKYKSPNAPGQRAGDNFGPMAQDLQKTKIGRTVVVEKADGLYVDTGRLALADHGALAHLAARVERLAAKVASSGKKDRK